ncbi:MAG: DNA double-strand break repair nuclease NurA, partial [Candidatus Micrarchaeota archaeon]
VTHKQHDYLVTAKTRIEDGKQLYEVSAKPINATKLEMPSFSLNSQDASIAKAGFKARPSETANVFRHYLEWKLVEEAVSGLDAGDVVVRDGTLQTSVVGEAEYARKAIEAAKEKGVLLTALAKTCGLVTTTGMPLVGAVAELCGEGKWFYSGFVENKHPDHEAELFVCRLHASSPYAFRFEINKEQAKMCDAPRVFALLADNSRDTAFLGYPYGLLDADKMARVSESETASLKAIMSAMGKGRGSETAFNAHDYI